MLKRMQQQRIQPHRGLWLERSMAIVASINLLLVAFDLSYIPWRDFYLRHLPALTIWYGEQFKGIEPHRDTEAYLDAVDQLEQAGLQSPQADRLLADLRSRSEQIIDENPFQVANKSGTLERIKNRMRDRVSQQTGERIDSSRAAFDTFWSANYLSRNGVQELEFFDREIRPLIETNYYRNIGENGQFIDRFWRIDAPFIALFAIEFLMRTYVLSRRHRRTTWFDTMLWRWYDVLLLLPFLRWLRIIPVTIRLQHAHLINLEPIRIRIVRGLVTHLAAEITETVFLRLIGELQDLIREGAVSRWLLQPQPQYIDINNVNEVEVITRRLFALTVQDVMPKVRPEVEALINHSVDRALQQNPIYMSLRSVPGLGNLPVQLAQQLVSQLYALASSAAKDTLNDEEGQQRLHQLVTKLGDTFKAELRQKKTLTEIEILLTELLEEIKANYVGRISRQDIDRLRQKNQQLYEIVQGRPHQLRGEGKGQTAERRR
ncbi:hypothetical protein H6F67_24800 [Microcoleus sp. FACHB-1515]|uniref:hypothetical protein n=1 Tax=Cyanophyceae TaxID=3028117 RepID=UPI0019A9C8E6|nr:hypothetical protein [Microcoleus sp. FACHB-1515]MBD2093071.1 hypothetical protein [Microcoleus sp. FACHB-1515]